MGNFYEVETPARLFRALGEPCRLAMVERLGRGPAPVTELAGSLGLPSALKHLRVLEEGGLVTSRKAGRVRTYSLRREALADVADWVRGRETDMHQAFDRLAAAMARVAEEDQG